MTAADLSQKKRITWIDILKGYGTIFVILAHLQSGRIILWIRPFLMPLFFFLSGYLFKHKGTLLQLIKKKTKTLMIPYFCLGLVLIVSYSIIHDCFNGPALYDLFLSLILQQRFLTIWFLTVLFLLEIVFYIITSFTDDDRILAVIALIALAFGTWYNKNIRIDMFWNADMIPMALPYFTGGYIMKKRGIVNKILNGKYKLLVFLACAIINYLCWKVNIRNDFYVDMSSNIYGSIFLTYLSAFLGIIALIILSYVTKSRIIRYIGENSMLYFAWHQYIFIPLTALFFSNEKYLAYFHIVFPDNAFGHAVNKVLQSIIILFIITVLNELISRSKLKFILGK